MNNLSRVPTIVIAIASLGLSARPLIAQTSTAADLRLLEAIDLYTGVAGHLDDAGAGELLLAAAGDEDDALTQMWIARVHSRGRMGFERNETRAREIAGRVITSVRSLAARGDVDPRILPS